MVVRLDLERDRLAFAEIDDARVLARPLQDAVAGRRQPLQQQRRMLVAAVLRPEQGEDRKLKMIRLAFEKFPDSLELPIGKPERAVQRLFRNLRQASSVSAPLDDLRRLDRRLEVCEFAARSRPRAKPGNARREPKRCRRGFPGGTSRFPLIAAGADSVGGVRN